LLGTISIKVCSLQFIIYGGITFDCTSLSSAVGGSHAMDIKDSDKTLAIDGTHATSC
jgi:hypothetical protein